MLLNRQQHEPYLGGYRRSERDASGGVQIIVSHGERTHMMMPVSYRRHRLTSLVSLLHQPQHVTTSAGLD